MPYQYGFADPASLAPGSSPPVSGADPLDSFVVSQGGLLGGTTHALTTATAHPAPTDPLDSFIASQGGLPNSPAPTRAPVSGDLLAQDMAAGGASPYVLDDLKQIGSGAWHGVSSMFNNAANLIEKGVAAGLGAIPGVRDTALAHAAARTANSDVAAQSAADQNFTRDASAGERASAFIAPLMVPMGGLVKAGNTVRAGVGALPGMGGNVGRAMGAVLANGTTGAAASLGAPIDPNQDYWSQTGKNLLTGAALGAGLPATFSITRRAGGALYDAARPLLNPLDYVGEGLASAIGDDAGQVAANIRGAPAFVPGSTPTTAQVGQHPALVATEKAQANSNPDFKLALAQRGIDNNDARWSALMGVAGTPADLQAAQASRDAVAAPLYQQAHQATANVGPAFMRYAQIPEMQEAMRRANDLASLDAAVGRGVPPVWPTPATASSQGSNAINGAALDYTSRALGDMINEAQRGGSTTRAGALATLKGNVDNWMTRYVPGVQQARSAYATSSVPINTMEAGQQIANGLGTRAMNPGGVPEIQLNQFRTALGRALGAQQYGIDPGAQTTLQRIGQDLQRATVSNSLKSPGSDTAYNVAANGWLARRLYGSNFEGGAVGRLLGGAAQAAGAAGGAALFGPAGAGVGSAVGSGLGSLINGSRVGGRLQTALGSLLLDSPGLLPYLDARAAAPVNVGHQALGQALLRQINPAIAGAATRGGLINTP